MLTSEGCLRALEMALHQERPKATTLIHHSDRGSQYCSFLYIHKLKEAGIAISMSQYGDPCENAIAERVNGILKTDFRLNQVFTSFEEAAGAVERSIHNYNHLRPHMSCDYLTPAVAHTREQPLKSIGSPSTIIARKNPPNHPNSRYIS
ncbi:MAG: integrase core domain-containing protein [Hymenobacter sp.]